MADRKSTAPLKAYPSDVACAADRRVNLAVPHLRTDQRGLTTVLGCSEDGTPSSPPSPELADRYAELAGVDALSWITKV